MGLRYWWMLIVWLAVGVAIWLFLRKTYTKVSRKQAKKQRIVPVAHMSRLTELPGYHKTLGRFKVWMVVLMASAGLAVLAGITLTARPMSQAIIEPELHNRDIMLCLDVSGSMVSVDKHVVEIFAEIADGFGGERIGLMVFDSSASMVFPLTDDYAFIEERLGEAAGQFADLSSAYAAGGSNIFLGTMNGDGSSLIGDGLASCVTRFDNLDVERSRSVILATDNSVAGKQIIDLQEAGVLAKDRGVRVYGINPSDYSTEYYDDEVAREFRETTMATDGGYYKVDPEKRDNVMVVKDIVDSISAQEAARFKGAPQLVQTDTPELLTWVTVAGLAALCIVSWRMGR